MLMSSFSSLGIEDRLVKLLKSERITKPTLVQSRTIAELLDKKNLIVKAKTGSGKTLAFLLPMLQLFIQNRIGGNKGLALILSPTRELALQTEKVIKLYSDNELNIVSLVGGQKIGEQKKMLEQKIDVLNCAPGRLIDFANSGFVDLTQVKYCVIDEGDRLLELGFYEDIKFILTQIPSLAQCSMFSATYHDELLGLAKQHIIQPVVIDTDEEGDEHLNITYYSFFIKDDNRFISLLHLLEKPWIGQSVVFVKGKTLVMDVCKQLKQKGFKAESFHADLDAVERDSAIRRFQSELINVLVCSDLAARGLDISGVSAVVNYHIPDSVELYIHRTGRTGRAFEKGVAYTFITSDKDLIQLKKWHKSKKLNMLNTYETRSIKSETNQSQKGNVYFRTIVFNKGKKDKFTPGHFVGFLTSELGIEREAIGNINVYLEKTEIELHAGAANKILNTAIKIKGKKVACSTKDQKSQKRYKNREIATRTQKSKKHNLRKT